MRLIRRILLLPLVALLAPAAFAAGATHEYRLANGLKLIVREDHRAPVVVSQIWYKVGSSYEPEGTTGISHALEHMMFKGTKKYGPGMFSRIIAENGGSENAFTSRDYTAYFQMLEKSRLPIAFKLEADRMQNLALKAKEYAKEIRVVKEERRMRTEDKPTALTGEHFMAAAFMESPYGQPVIGWDDDLNHLTVKDLRAWYHRWYAPNNATLVVAGDVRPRAIYRLAKKYFGPIPARRIVPVKPRIEPVQRGERRIVVKAPAKLPYLVMGYKTPNLKAEPKSWEPYALDVLAGVLDGGDSARLSRELVRGSAVATSAGAGYSLYARLPGLFELDAIPAQGHTVKEVENALLDQVRKLQQKPVSAAELERVKAQVVADKVYQRDSVFYQAMQIGMLESVGLDWRLADEYADKIRAVTPAQVQAVARKYLIDDHLTVAVLEPQPLKAGQRAGMSMGGSDVVR